MMRVKKVAFLLLAVWFCIYTRGSCAVGNLTTTPESSNGVLTVCPGDPISLTCTHNNTDDAVSTTDWEISGVVQCVVVHRQNPPLPQCSQLTVTMVSDNSGPTVSTTAQITAAGSLDGMVVECLGGASSISSGSVNISVLSIPTPSITVLTQVSQSTVEVNLEVSNNSPCAATFVATATQDGGSETISNMSSTSPVSVSGLDVCRYNYSFVGNVVTSGGVAGSMSDVNSFTADLSVLRGVNVTINQGDPLIEWVQMDNPLYPTCITGYEIRDAVNESLVLTVDNSTRSVSGQNLIAFGLPYCSRIQPTVAPVTPMRILRAVPGSNTNVIDLIDPDFPQPMLSPTFPPLTRSENTTVITLRVNLMNVLQSVVPTRSYQYILNGATFPVMNFIGDYFKIELPESAAGQEISVNVTFQNGPCNSLSSDIFIVPRLEITGLTQGQPTDTSHTINITLPLTEYQPEQLLIISTVEPPSDDGPIVADFTSPSMQYTATFTGLTDLTTYNFTIRIVIRLNNNADVVPAIIGTFTTSAPLANITINSVLQVSAPCYIVTFTPSEVAYPPRELVIMSILTTDQVSSIVNATSEFSSQKTVMFCDISPGHEYSYTIRIVLQRNTNVDVVYPVTGSFTLNTPTASMISTEASIAIAVSLTFLLTLVLGVSIGVLSVLGYQRCRRSGQSSQTETEMKTPTAAEYEEPVVSKPDPHTQGNVAYGHVQF